MPVAYRNTRTGRVVHLAEPLPSLDRSRRWQRVDPADSASEPGIDSPATADSVPSPEPTPPPAPFDPAEHTVRQVNEHLAGADMHERERVLQAEAEGRGRRGVLSGPHSDLSGG